MKGKEMVHPSCPSCPRKNSDFFTFFIFLPINILVYSIHTVYHTYIIDGLRFFFLESLFLLGQLGQLGRNIKEQVKSKKEALLL
jgi:hypothetical protein